MVSARVVDRWPRSSLLMARRSLRCIMSGPWLKGALIRSQMPLRSAPIATDDAILQVIAWPSRTPFLGASPGWSVRLKFSQDILGVVRMPCTTSHGLDKKELR